MASHDFLIKALLLDSDNDPLPLVPHRGRPHIKILDCWPHIWILHYWVFIVGLRWGLLTIGCTYVVASTNIKESLCQANRKESSSSCVAGGKRHEAWGMRQKAWGIRHEGGACGMRQEAEGMRHVAWGMKAWCRRHEGEAWEAQGMRHEAWKAAGRMREAEGMGHRAWEIFFILGSLLLVARRIPLLQRPWIKIKNSHQKNIFYKKCPGASREVRGGLGEPLGGQHETLQKPSRNRLFQKLSGIGFQASFN